MWKLVNFTDELSLLATSHNACTCVSTKEYNLIGSVHCEASKYSLYEAIFAGTTHWFTYICSLNMYLACKLKIELHRMFTLKKDFPL